MISRTKYYRSKNRPLAPMNIPLFHHSVQWPMPIDLVTPPKIAQ
jgi:hypothetical protein